MVTGHDLQVIKRYRSVIEAMDSGHLLGEVIFDENGRAIDIQYLDENAAATRMVGASLVGKRLREVSSEYEARRQHPADGYA